MTELEAISARHSVRKLYTATYLSPLGMIVLESDGEELVGLRFMETSEVLPQALDVCPVVDPLYTQEKIVKTDPMSGWDRQNLQRETYAKVDWTAPKTFSVYLPAGAQWYDYWTNAKLNGGQTITASAPLSHSPLYIKAGSILPLGPDVQYANG